MSARTKIMKLTIRSTIRAHVIDIESAWMMYPERRSIAYSSLFSLTFQVRSNAPLLFQEVKGLKNKLLVVDALSYCAMQTVIQVFIVLSRILTIFHGGTAVRSRLLPQVVIFDDRSRSDKH